jgi:Na+/proline symporter
LAVVNNLFNTINMILGASSAITYLSVRQKSSKSTSGKSANLSSTGMHIMASTFLLPLGVVIYTLTGGIKATYELAYFY